MATDDDAVLPSSQNGLDEPERPEAPGERLEFKLGDATWIGGIDAKGVDGDAGNSHR